MKMSPEVPNMGLPALEQPEQTSPQKLPLSHKSESSSSDPKAPEDMATAPGETKNETPVHTADVAPADLLKSAVGDEADEDFFVAKAKV